MERETPDRSYLIAEMNDTLRKTGRGGVMVMTDGVRMLGDQVIEKIVNAVREFSEFTADNDPYGEHDYGIAYVGENTILWKVDYYDPSLTRGSEDPTDSDKTCRVLTIMLREEY